MKDEKKKKHKSALYGNCILACCGFVCIVVVFLAFYNHAKIIEYKNKQTKLDSVFAMQDSIKLQKMNQLLEKQADTLSSQLSILDKDLKTLNGVLKSTIIKEK